MDKDWGWVVGLNKTEKQALYGQTPFVKWMYEHGIREHMDYATGIVGIERRISYQSLREEMFVEPEAGVSDSGTPTKNKIIRAIARLERLGLLKRIDERPLVFECVLANRDKSVQKQAGRRQVADKGYQVGLPLTPKKPVTTGISEPEQPQAGTQAGTPENGQAGTPPLSFRDNTKNVLSLLSDEDVADIFETHFWQHWPKDFRAKKKEALDVYRKKKLYQIKDTIQADICVRKKRHRAWLEGYVPHPTTYLRGERWTDEIQEVTSNGGGKRRNSSRSGESIEAILDSCYEQPSQPTEVGGEFTAMD